MQSVENSAWHQLKKGEKLGGTLLYKIDQSSKKIYILYSLNYDHIINHGTTIADFSSIVNNINTISGTIYDEYDDGENFMNSLDGSRATFSISNPASIAINNDLLGGDTIHIGITDGAYFTYDSLK